MGLLLLNVLQGVSSNASEVLPRVHHAQDYVESAWCVSDNMWQSGSPPPRRVRVASESTGGGTSCQVITDRHWKALHGMLAYVIIWYHMCLYSCFAGRFDSRIWSYKVYRRSAAGEFDQRRSEEKDGKRSEIWESHERHAFFFLVWQLNARSFETENLYKSFNLIWSAVLASCQWAETRLIFTVGAKLHRDQIRPQTAISCNFMQCQSIS